MLTAAEGVKRCPAEGLQRGSTNAIHTAISVIRDAGSLNILFVPIFGHGLRSTMHRVHSMQSEGRARERCGQLHFHYQPCALAETPKSWRDVHTALRGRFEMKV